MDVLYLNNDHLVSIHSLRDAQGNAVAGATATATLYEADGTTEVQGVSWPITLVYQGHCGDYQGEVPASVTLVPGRRYKMKITAISVGKQFEVLRTVVAKIRNA